MRLSVGAHLLPEIGEGATRRATEGLQLGEVPLNQAVDLVREAAGKIVEAQHPAHVRRDRCLGRQLPVQQPDPTIFLEVEVVQPRIAVADCEHAALLGEGGH